MEGRTELHVIAPQTVQEVTDALHQGLGGDPPGCHPPTHREHAQTLSGVHTGTWGPYTVLGTVMSGCDKSHASWITTFSFFLSFSV